ncbi:MAG: hypothetical protein ACPIOQ_45650, partial [Promethearchaeia archaeon]
MGRTANISHHAVFFPLWSALLLCSLRHGGSSPRSPSPLVASPAPPMPRYMQDTVSWRRKTRTPTGASDSEQSPSFGSPRLRVPFEAWGQERRASTPPQHSQFWEVRAPSPDRAARITGSRSPTTTRPHYMQPTVASRTKSKTASRPGGPSMTAQVPQHPAAFSPGGGWFWVESQGWVWRERKTRKAGEERRARVVPASAQGENKRRRARAEEVGERGTDSWEEGASGGRSGSRGSSLPPSRS